MIWLVALSEELQEEKTTEQVIALYIQKLIDSETVVWREGMEQWQGLFEIPELVHAFAARGIHPPPPELTSPGSGVRDVSAAPDGVISGGAAALPAFDFPSEPAASRQSWHKDMEAYSASTASKRGTFTDEDENEDKHLEVDLDDEATIALDRDVAHGMVQPKEGALLFVPVDDEAPARRVPPERVDSSSRRLMPLPAAGQPAALHSDPAPSFPPPPPSSRATVVPPVPPRAPLAAPALHLVAPPESRRSTTLWVVLFAAFVTLVVVLAVVRRLL